MKKSLFIAIIATVIFFVPIKADDSQSQLQLKGIVPSCILNLTVKPEKRAPLVNNWGTIINVEIYKSGGSLVVSFSTPTDEFGKSSINICSLKVYPTAGYYDFYIKGYSNLRAAFKNIYTFSSQTSYLDFSKDNEYLITGETSNIFDNYINAIDLSTQMNAMYTNDYKNDLNQDGKVNSVDISDTLINFYK